MEDNGEFGIHIKCTTCWFKIGIGQNIGFLASYLRRHLLIDAIKDDA